MFLWCNSNTALSGLDDLVTGDCGSDLSLAADAGVVIALTGQTDCVLSEWHPC